MAEQRHNDVDYAAVRLVGPHDVETDTDLDIEPGTPPQCHHRNRLVIHVGVVVGMVGLVAAVIEASKWSSYHGSDVVSIGDGQKLFAKSDLRETAVVGYKALPVDRILNTKPALCDSAIVKRTCKKLNGGVAADKVTVAALSQLCDASESSVQEFLNNINVFSQSGVPCQELCKKAVASFAPGQLPTKSLVHCTQIEGAQTHCSTNITGPNDSRIVGSTGAHNGMTFEGPPITSHPATPVKDAGSPSADKRGFKPIGVLRKTVVRFFEIYPIVHQKIVRAKAHASPYQLASGYCQGGSDILTQGECQTASTSLGLTFNGAWNGPGDHKDCLANGQNVVYFNMAGTAAAATPPNPTYKSICQTHATNVAVAPAPPPPPPPLVPASILDGIGQVQVALSRAIVDIGAIGNNVNSPEGKVFIRWFGTLDSKSAVLHMLNGVNERIDYDPPTIAWTSKQNCAEAGSNVYAYTFSPEVLDANGLAIVYVCPKYFETDLLTRRETLLHEVSHLQPMDSDDFVYGYTPCMNLAYECKKGYSEKCEEAKDNGDSIAYYVFDANNEYNGVNSLTNRAKTWAYHYAKKGYTKTLGSSA